MQIQVSLFELVNQFKHAMREGFRQFELPINPMHFRVLQLLAQNQTLTPLQIAEYLQRDKGQITRLLKELVAMELLIKRDNPEDKRSQLLALSSQAIELLAPLKDVEKQVVARMTKNLSDQQLTLFTQLTQVMSENLKGN